MRTDVGSFPGGKADPVSNLAVFRAKGLLIRMSV